MVLHEVGCCTSPTSPAPPPGSIGQCWEISVGQTGLLIFNIEAGNATKPPTRYWTAPTTKSHSAQHVRSSKVQKPWPTDNINNRHTITKWWTFTMAKTKIEKILKWHNEARMIKNYLRFISWHKDFHENKKKCWWYKGWGMHYNLFHHCALINKKMVLSVCLSMRTCIKDTKLHPTLHFNKITLK